MEQSLPPAPTPREGEPAVENPVLAGSCAPAVIPSPGHHPPTGGYPSPAPPDPATPSGLPTPTQTYAASLAAGVTLTFEQVQKYHRNWLVEEGKREPAIEAHEKSLALFLKVAGLTLQSVAAPSLTTDFPRVYAEVAGRTAKLSKVAKTRLSHLRMLRDSFEQMARLRDPDYVPVAFTYGLFRERYKHYLNSAGFVQGTIDNRLGTLRHWCDCFGLGDRGVVGRELLDPQEFASKHEQFSTWCQARKKRKDHGQTLLDRDCHLRDIHHAACSLHLVSPKMSVGKAVRRVIVASAGTVEAFIQAHPGLKRGEVETVCAGARRPSREFLSTVERLAGVTVGTLTDLLPPPSTRRPATLLSNTPTGKILYALSKEPYALRRKSFPAKLKQQCIAFTRHKVGGAGSQGRYRRRHRWSSDKGYGSDPCPTGEIFWQAVGGFMGWLHHVGKTPLDGLDFSLLSRSDLVLGFADFLAGRRGKITGTGTHFLHIPLQLLNEGWGFIYQEPEFATGLGLDLENPETWTSLFSAWGALQDDAHAVAVAVALAGGDVELAPAGEEFLDEQAGRCEEHAALPKKARWETWCRINRIKIAAGFHERDARREIGRPHQERSGDLLALDRPDLALLKIIHRQIDDVPAAHTGLRHRWEHARDSVLLVMAYFTACRQKQFRECTFIPSRHAEETAPWRDRGGLQWNAGRYEVWVAVPRLKNGRSLKERHPLGYVRHAFPTRYNAVVERYLRLRDEVLARNPLPPSERHALLFTWNKLTKQTHVMHAGNVTHQVTRTTFAYGGEVLGKGLSPHLFRHVRATGMIKAGEKKEKVAYLLGDKEETVMRHYKHWPSVNEASLEEMHTQMALDCDG